MWGCLTLPVFCRFGVGVGAGVGVFFIFRTTSRICPVAHVNTYVYGWSYFSYFRHGHGILHGP